MRLFIRNRARYNPEMPDSDLISVTVNDYTNTYIWNLKEDAKRQRALKMDELFHFSNTGMQRLEDGRTVAHYNLIDGDILESTSNPFFAACMNILAIEATRKHAAATADNDRDAGDTQPPNFQNVNDFVNFIHAHPKKGAEMSHYTETDLHNLFREYTTIDISTIDPIRSLVSRYRERMGLQYMQGDPDVDTVTDEDQILNGIYSAKRQSFVHGRGKNVIKESRASSIKQPLQGNKFNAPNIRKSPTKKKDGYYCYNCEKAETASSWCQECDGGQGMALCLMCNNFLHMRRRHRVQPISEAPKVPKKYIPHAYRAPFALVVGLFSGHNREPKRISMAEDELRAVSQGLTDTDLFDKSPGKIVGGFDAIDTLITRGLVKREAIQHPTYALTQAGIDLGKRLLKYHAAVVNAMNNMVPKVPSSQNIRDSLMLIVDDQERKKTRMIELTEKRGLNTEIRSLPTGDYIWIVKNGGEEMVLPCVVERKTWDDLHHSLQDNRFRKQISAMQRLEFRNRFYLVEGNRNDMRSKPTLQQKEHLQACLDDLILNEGFKVNYTGSWFKTAEWLTQLTNILAESYENGTLGPLMSYSEFSRRARSFNFVMQNIPTVPVYHQWKAEEYVEIIQGQTIEEQPFVIERAKDKLNFDRPMPLEHHLLVIEGLETYNKARQKCLNDCLNLAFSDTTKTVKEFVCPHLKANLELLIHYDVQQYYSLVMQVNLDVYVVRKENMHDSQTLKTNFINKDINGNVESKHRDVAGYILGRKDQKSEAGSTLNYDDDLQKAIALSLQESSPTKKVTSVQILDDSLDKFKNNEMNLKYTSDENEDEKLARQLQEEFNKELVKNEVSSNDYDNIDMKFRNLNELNTLDQDMLLARQMQEELNQVNETAVTDYNNTLPIIDTSLDEEIARKLQNDVNGDDVLPEETYTPSVNKDKSRYFKGMRQEKQKLNDQLDDYRKVQQEKYSQCAFNTSQPNKFSASPIKRKTSVKSEPENVVVLDSESEDEEWIPNTPKRICTPSSIFSPRSTYKVTSPDHGPPPSMKYTPSSSLPEDNSQGNMTCGACRQKGHNRKWSRCPMYYTADEMERREKEKRARTQRREQKLKEKQDAINAFEAQRDGLVDQMRETQQRFQDAISNVSTLIQTVHKKPAAEKKK